MLAPKRLTIGHMAFFTRSQFQVDWASLSMDIITDLRRVEGYDTVLVILDQFSKMTHIVPCYITILREETT